ncbi:MAG: hypothetical protein ABEJ89_02605, partial [Haloarculaceae archaeon]
MTKNGSRLRYDLRVTDLPDDARVWIVVGDAATVTSASSLERVGSERWARFAWTGQRSVNLSVTVRPADRPAGTAAGEEWAFGPAPLVEGQTLTGGRVVRSQPLTRRTAGADGVEGRRFALVGAHTTVTRSTPGGGRIRVVAPPSTDGLPPTAVADALIEAGRRLNVGDRGDDMLAFEVPGVRPGGNSVPAYDEFWVNASEPLASARSVW